LGLGGRTLGASTAATRSLGIAALGAERPWLVATRRLLALSSPAFVAVSRIDPAASIYL